MKIFASNALVLGLGILTGACTPSAGADTLPPGMINFRAASIPTVLDVYTLLSRKTLVTDSRIKEIGTRITVRNERPLSEEEAAILIERTLLEQAAIVITPLGGHSASVTYNDALPIVPSPAGNRVSTNGAPPAPHPVSVMQHFRVDTNSFFLTLRSRKQPGRQQSEVSLLKDYFKQHGIDVSPPFSALYRPTTGDLLIRPRQADWETIQRLMTELQSSK